MSPVSSQKESYSMIVARAFIDLMASDRVFDVANGKVRAERNAQKTEVIYFVNDLGEAPPKWRLGDAEHGRGPHSTAGSITLGVTVGPPQFQSGPSLGKDRRHSSHARRCPVVSGVADQRSQLHQILSASARPLDPVKWTCSRGVSSQVLLYVAFV